MRSYIYLPKFRKHRQWDYLKVIHEPANIPLRDDLADELGKSNRFYNFGLIETQGILLILIKSIM